MTMSKLMGLFDKLNNTEIKINYRKKSLMTEKSFYIFAFCVPIVILLIAYAIFGMYPFGNKSVLISDLQGQYVSYYLNFRDALWEDRSVFYSWSRNLSGEMFGIYAYYMASPFMLIVILFPRSMIELSIMIMQLLKVGTSSVTMGCYLRKSQNLNIYSSLVFSLLYSLSLYSIGQMMNTMWIDGMIYLPLICLGIEKLVDNGKTHLFIISLALLFVANFYIGWMAVIFSCLYFIAYLFFISEKYCSYKIKGLLIQGVKFALSGILSAVCAAWILIPVYHSLSLGKLNFIEPDYTKIAKFDFIDIFSYFLPNTYDTNRAKGSPELYCGVLTIILVALFFLNNGINLRKKIGYGILVLVMILSMYFYSIDIIWHGFSEPIWFNYRYAFMLCFLLIAMAARSFEKIKEVNIKKIALVFAVIVLYVFLLDKTDEFFVYDDNEHPERIYDVMSTVWFTVVLAFVYTMILYFYQKNCQKIDPKKLVCFVTIIELIISSSITLDKIGTDLIYATYGEYTKEISLGKNTVEQINDLDDNIYRIELKNDIFDKVNYIMAYDSFGVSHSSSLLNSRVLKFLKSIGFDQYAHYTFYNGATYVSDAVLGIKYVMESENLKNDATDFFSLLSSIGEPLNYRHYDNEILENSNSDNVIHAYENPYALPVAFMADISAANVEFESADDPFENQNKLLSALISDKEQDFFRRISFDDITAENAICMGYADHIKYKGITEESNASVTFKFTAPTNDMLYMYMPSDYPRGNIGLWLNDGYLDRYYLNKGNIKQNIVTLGRHKGEQMELTIKIIDSPVVSTSYEYYASERNEVIFKDNYVYYLDEEKFVSAVDELKKYPLNIDYFKEDHIKGTITSPKDGIMFTSIPFEPGWTIYVDGVKTEPVKLFDALMGVPLNEGTHNIEMKFFPYGLTEGIIVSVIGVIIVIFIALKERKNH